MQGLPAVNRDRLHERASLNVFYLVICRLPGHILQQHRLYLHAAQGGFQGVGQKGKIAL